MSSTVAFAYLAHTMSQSNISMINDSGTENNDIRDNIDTNTNEFLSSDTSIDSASTSTSSLNESNSRGECILHANSAANITNIEKSEEDGETKSAVSDITRVLGNMSFKTST